MSDVDALPIGGGSFSMPVPGAIPEALPRFDSESEEALALRYGRRQRKIEDLTFEFTRDPALLHQYFRIYESECRVVDSPEYRAKEKEHDRRSHILIVRQGNLCVGGARLSVRTPRQPRPLPMEINGFRLADYFPQLAHSEVSYGEWSRVVVLPDFRNGDVSSQILLNLYRKTVAVGLDYAFGTAPKINLRSYRQHLKAHGVDVKLHYDIEIPPYPSFEDVKDYLVSLVVGKPSDWGKEDAVTDNEKALLDAEV